MILQELKESVASKDILKSQEKLEAFNTSSKEMMAEFDEFKTEQHTKSETYRYWDTYVEMVSLLKNLIRADREGDWELHLTTVQKILPICCF